MDAVWKNKNDAENHACKALLSRLVALDFAVADADHAVGVEGDVGFVGDENDGVALLVEPREEDVYKRQPYHKPTQVDKVNIHRRSRERSLRN